MVRSPGGMSSAMRRVALVALLALPMASCDSSTVVRGAEVQAYLARVSVNGIIARLVEEEPPLEGSGPAVTVPLNGEVITGGSTQVDLTGGTLFNQVIVFVDGVDGYFVADLPLPVSTAEILVTIGGRPPELLFDAVYQVRDTNGNLGTYGVTSLSATQVIGGDIQVSVTWNTRADVDLHVIEPGGREIYYGNRESVSGGKLDIDANAACSTSTLYQENIGWLPGTAPSGSYIVRVDYWSACGVPQTDYTVTISLRPGTPFGSVQTFSGTLTGTGTNGGAGAGETITTFTF